LKGKDLLSIADLNREDIPLLISRAIELKEEGWRHSLSEKVLALVFEKPSLRTRVSFEIAMRQMGGYAIYLSHAEVGLGKREPVPDVARVLSRYVDAIAARTFSHETLELLAQYADVPVINALSDLEHPCQALADLLGDGNNVAHSLMLASALAGIHFRIASPAGYQVRDDLLELARGYAMESGTEILCTEDPRQAVNEADIVYTDVWTSMGQEDESEKRRRAFSGYQIDDELLAQAEEGAILMHPLPAHQGEEVAGGVLDSPQSVVFDQAENRMHLQKALLAEMLGGLEIPLMKYE
jgi:ornithine carbamoyltransferase